MDKLKILFAALVIALIIGGCAPVEEVVEEPVIEEEIEHAPEVEEPEPEPEPEMSQELIDLLENSNKVKSFEYRYKAPGVIQATYWFRGDNVKVSYKAMQKHNDFYYYDVYINTAEETVYLICDDFDDCKGKKGTTANYLDFEPPRTPWMIVQSIEYGTISEHTQIDNKDTVVVNFVNVEGNQEKLWVWEYWGMPLQREVMEDGTKQMYYYDDVVVNGVKDEDFDMPDDIEMI